MISRLVACFVLLSGGLNAQPLAWPLAMTDPAAKHQGAADLVLPMPCGASMAFQKVEVPVDARDPLADRRMRLGQSVNLTGYSDYLRSAFLRGPFSERSNVTYFYIARYELTQGQFRVLQGDCAPPTRADRIARGGMSWHDAVTLAKNYTSWLYLNVPEAVPESNGVRGFLRLPTEVEWEYAARGGTAVDANAFPELTYFDTGEMRDHALHQGIGSGRGRLGAVGVRAANPLGLYDIYGNVEELMLEPYRMNARGRVHGQVGGVVTRGGSVLSEADQIYSAQRTEYPPFDSQTGHPLRGETFGARFVISAHVATSEAKLAEIQKRWGEMVALDPEKSADPATVLADLARAEPDLARQEQLTELLLGLRRNQDQMDIAIQQSARASFLAGAAFVEALKTSAEAIEVKAVNIRMLASLQRAGNQSEMFDRQLQGHVQQIAEMRARQSGMLLSFRAILGVLSEDVPPDTRASVLPVLREELVLSGQIQRVQYLDEFSLDLEAFIQKPDLSTEELMSEALK
jgi:Sulfatase-modifying factor enzyme 1